MATSTELPPLTAMESSPAARPVASTFARHFYAALAVLVLAKVILVAHNLFEMRTWDKRLGLLPKALLFFGYDVIGATVVALVAATLHLRVRPIGARAAGVLQAAHAVLVIVSMWAFLRVGAPLDKAGLDLATLQDAGEGDMAVLSSVTHYLGFWPLLSLAVGMALPWWVARRFTAPRLPRPVLALASAMAVTTAVILPGLVTGRIGGIRLHTYGLEGSAGWTLVASYVRAASRGWVSEPPHRVDLRPVLVDDHAEPIALAGATPKRTNLVVVQLESMGQRSFDEDPSRMPTLARADRDGVRFATHYSTWPQTMKSLFSISCSELPYPDYRTITMVAPEIPCHSLAETLARAGYHTAMWTSANLAYDRKRRFYGRRFAELYDMYTMPGSEQVWHNSWGQDERHTDATLSERVDQQPAERPWFAFYSQYIGHHPYSGSQEHVDHPLGSDYENYVRAMGFADAAVAQLMDGLRSRGLEDDTLVVLISDHGEGFARSHAGVLSHGPKVYEEVVRSPWAIFGPQVRDLDSPRVQEGVTSHLDVAPTVLGLLGLEVPCSMRGRNLLVDGSRRIALMGGRPPGGQYAIVDGSWKLIESHEGARMLFDLHTDPREQQDVAALHPERAARLAARLGAYVHGQVGVIEDYAAVTTARGCSVAAPGSAP